MAARLIAPRTPRPIAHPRPCRHALRGSTLIESLLAFFILAAGVLSITQLQLHLRVQDELSRQRSAAMHLAQEDIESLRAQAYLPSGSSPTAMLSFEQIDSTSASIDAADGHAPNANFLWQRQIDPGVSPRLKEATVRLSWDGRDGSRHQALLNTVITGASPALAGALMLPPNLPGPARGYGRAAGLPWLARDLGQGRVAVVLDGVAYVSDPLNAQVTQRCTDVPPGTTTEQLQASDLTHCSPWRGLWLSGVVRFSDATPPDPAMANDTPLDTALSIVLTEPSGAPTPACRTDLLKTVQYRLADGLYRQAVPLQATPSSVGALEWSELVERYLAYHCMVPTATATGRWSGRSTLVPQGWTLGTAATDHKVCRYVADLDHSGAIDRNDEHPSTYQGVDHALMQQNFLVIRGDQPCPDGTAARIEPLARWHAADNVTVQHQP